MINYDEIKVGDVLKIVGQGAPGMAKLGDLVRVTAVEAKGVHVETSKKTAIHFVFNCGAARLEPTEWKSDFDEDRKPVTEARGPVAGMSVGE